jgi:hypothetical protein
MPPWLSSWLSLWTLGACATLGLGMIVTAVAEAVDGGQAVTCCALWFGGMGFVLLAAIIFRNSGRQIGL